MPVSAHECATWDEFKSAVRLDYYGTDSPRARRIYRGHGNSRWRLVPPIHRLCRPGGRSPEYRFNPDWEHYLSTFKQFLTGMPDVDADSIGRSVWEMWALGRHFGLLTPLLDWTKSPYIAAFFAFWSALESILPGIQDGLRWGTDVESRETLEAPHESAKVTIWSLLRPVDEHGNVQQEMPGATGVVFLDKRRDAFHRQKAQQGVFTRLNVSEIDLETYLEQQDMSDRLSRYDIPARCLVEALAELRLMNINLATLFPDIAGAALQANVDDLMQGIFSSGAA